VEYFSTEQGLSHSRISEILKDNEGFMWFATWDGINRFDGRSFVSYKANQGEMSQKGDYRIAQILEDESGYLWIRTYRNHVYRFDKKTKAYFPVSSLVSTDAKQDICFDKIYSVSNGFVWIKSPTNGLFCFPQHSLTNRQISRFSTDQPKHRQLPSKTIRVFHEDMDHRIWIGTPDGWCCLAQSGSGQYEKKNIIPDGIARRELTDVEEDKNNIYFSTVDGSMVIYNKQQQSFSTYKMTNSRINSILRSLKAPVVYGTTADGHVITFSITNNTFSTKQYRHESLYSLYEDQTGALWIEPKDSGVIRFNPINSSFSFFSQAAAGPTKLMGNHFNVFEDVRGTIWVNMKAGGFGYYNAARSTMEYSLDAVNMPGFQLPQSVDRSYYDSTGVLWLRMHGGLLVRVILQEDNFKQQLLADQRTGYGYNEVRGILCDNRNRLWLASKRGKLYLRQDEKWVNGFLTNEPAGGLGNVYVIFEDSRHNVWLGTKGNGLFKATPKDSQCTQYELTHFSTGNSKGEGRNDIYSIIEDKSGCIWVGTYGSGLAMVSAHSDSLQFIHHAGAFKNYPQERFAKIRHMNLDNAGNIWVGATDGLLIIHPDYSPTASYIFKSYSRVPDRGTGLASSDIQFIYRNPGGGMWLATAGAGICLATGNPITGLAFKSYTTRDGLPNDYVLSCTGDSAGNLWIATENILSRFNPATGIFRNYDSYDDLPKVNFSEAAACRELTNGNLIFGSSDGYIVFDPNHASMRPVSANIVFTNLQINKQDVHTLDNTTAAKTDINYTSELLLKYNENIINIDYALLDPRAGNRQAFAYRLIGFDTTWHADRAFKGAAYTNLPPGDYTLEVRSLYDELYVTTPYKRLHITILPPPWKTWWAYLCYAVFIVLVLAIIRHHALKMVKLRNKVIVEQRLSELKLNFFTGISHELRTPLTLIVNPLEVIANRERLSPEGATYLEVARRNADRMIRFTNQLLDLRKIQSEKARLTISRIEVVGFVQKICDHFIEAIDSKQIRLELSAEAKEIFVFADIEKLDVIIYNLLSNAIKFSPKGEVIRIFIESCAADNNFTIIVRDHGPGVTMEKIGEIFELFQQGENTTDTYFKSNGIGLALCKEFVMMHGGAIHAANNEDGGLTMTVTMKLGHEFAGMVASNKCPEAPVELPGNELSTHVDAGPLSEAPLLLLVEDNSDLCLFLRGQLSESFRVETASNGKEGWEKALALVPDLIVSDIMMPEMDGIQLLDKIKNDIHTSHIPVVLLSAKYSIESQVEGLKYGADCYITKPFNNALLVASINNILRQRKKLSELLVQRKRPASVNADRVVMTSKDEAFIKNVILTVEERMIDAQFKIETIAEAMAMGQKTFYRKLKSLTGVAPGEFVRDIRLQKAKQLLDTHTNNVSEVAYLVGFTSPKYFATCFKEKYQVSPSDYLKSGQVQVLSA
jgi:signal transduction histidine kinase/ligand-binding sensor domain-containing protein/DNA-binding response OmpR family regulator